MKSPMLGQQPYGLILCSCQGKATEHNDSKQFCHMNSLLLKLLVDPSLAGVEKFYLSSMTKHNQA